MFGFLEGFAQKGVSMIILQVLRVFTIVGLASVMASCWVLAIKINMDKPYFVFDAASLVFMSGIALFLALSELPFSFTKNFFNTHWPAFSQHCGLAWLGLALVMIGCNTIGKLNNAATEPDEIGMPWWRLVLASGVLNLVFGILNILASFILHDYKESLNVRVIRSSGAGDHEDSLPYSKSETFSGNGSIKEPKRAWFRGFWGKDSGKKKPLRIVHEHLTHNEPEHNTPAQGETYAHTSDVRSDHGPDAADDGHSSPRQQWSPIAPGWPRPESHLHPYRRENPAEAFRNEERPASSVYTSDRVSKFKNPTAAGWL